MGHPHFREMVTWMEVAHWSPSHRVTRESPLGLPSGFSTVILWLPSSNPMGSGGPQVDIRCDLYEMSGKGTQSAQDGDDVFPLAGFSEI